MLGFQPDQLAVQRDALPFGRHGHPLIGNVEDPASDRLAVVYQADNHGEMVAAGREIGGTVERIDDPASLARPADQVEQPRIVLGLLLAHHGHARQNPGETRSQALLGRDIGHGHHITGPFLADVVLGKVAETRQQLGCRCLAHQRRDPLGIAGAEHRPQPTTPNRSSSLRITWSLPSSLTSVPDHLP